MFIKRYGILLSTFCALGVSSAWAAAGTLSVGNVSAAPGATVDVPVTLAAGAARDISTLQFDLVLPKGVTAGEVKAGSAATAASKSVSTAKVADGLRVIVFGLNRTAIRSGDIVSIKLTLPKSVAEKSLPLTVKNVVFSDEKGNKINVKSKSGAIQIAAPVASAHQTPQHLF